MSAKAAILPRVSHWHAKYSAKQRAAVRYAYCDARIRPAAQIARMAAAGELREGADGDVLDAFEIPASTVIDIGKRHDRQRRGEGLSKELAEMPYRDRAHHFQLRLSALIDALMTDLEDQQRIGRKPLEIKRLQEIVRLLRELATVPDPSERRLPTVPGQREPDGKQRGATRTGMGASIITAADASTSPSTRATQADITTGQTEDTTTLADDAPARDDQADDDTQHHDD